MVAAVNLCQRAVQAAGGSIAVTSGYRSTEHQAELYAARGSNPYPVAVPGTSKHERGEAVDMVISPRSWQNALGGYWEALGGRWGGRFRQSDPVHFETP